MKDHEKYEYVEVALPKDNQAVQRMLAYSERYAKPMRAIVREAAIENWTEDDGTEVMRHAKTTKKSAKRTKAKGAVITDASKESANSLLDDMGF